ncbi:YggT family protein [Bacillus anthracis]|uniref:YggT family protein n=1 Tax=Bacillus anthracis TaxID=1392 RepID=UPI001ADFE1F0|nr:YggT family protein [Bacillus anthracis]MBP0702741.1 YggT family protein [Bacillus anthracis]MBP0734155.1 YggT family protein [Bacillus anthracis]MBP0771427.1 YggT family protein [Bacillus anthracis]MBP0918371.1 YggT family protein [Bacillus anthracis]HDR5461952.1 YggT family protein [Bacillus anthracis]
METVLRLLVTAIEIYSWALIIYILLSWFPGAKESTFGDFLARICEPYLEPFRRFIPPLGMIDISPLVAIFALKLSTSGLVTLFGYFL